MRSLAAVGLVAALTFGGCTTTPPPSVVGGSFSPSPTSTAESARASDPTPSVEPTATTAPFAPDRYPPELVGRLFAVRPATDSTAMVLRRIGTPDRIALPEGEWLLGIDGDRVVTSRTVEGGVMVTIWAFSTGGRVTEPLLVATLHGPYGLEAGDFVIASSTGLPDGIVGGITAISSVDGSVRQLVPASSPASVTNPSRAIAVSRSGDRIVTTVCATGVDFEGDCGPATVIDVATGRKVGSLDPRGGVPVELTSDGLLLYWLDHIAVVDLNGHQLWMSPSYTGTRFLQDARFLDDRTVLARVLLASGSARRRLLLFDARTGKSHTLATLTGEPGSRDALPDVIDALSTDRFLAIGTDIPACGIVGLACDPDDRRVLDASILDIASGELTPDAIHLNLTP